MSKLLNLSKWRSHDFSSGSYRGEDYVKFERELRSYVKSLCKERNLEVVKFDCSHYECSWFVKNTNDEYLYFSISDVRFFLNEWWNHILFRTAQNVKDFTGGKNQYISLENMWIVLDRFMRPERNL